MPLRLKTFDEVKFSATLSSLKNVSAPTMLSGTSHRSEDADFPKPATNTVLEKGEKKHGVRQNEVFPQRQKSVSGAVFLSSHSAMETVLSVSLRLVVHQLRFLSDRSMLPIRVKLLVKSKLLDKVTTGPPILPQIDDATSSLR